MNRVGRAIAENSKFSLAVCDSDQKIHQTHLNQIRNEQINHNGRFSDFDLQYGGKVNSSPPPLCCGSSRNSIYRSHVFNQI